MNRNYNPTDKMWIISQPGTSLAKSTHLRIKICDLDSITENPQTASNNPSQLPLQLTQLNPPQ